MLERDILDNANVRKDLLNNNKSLIAIEEYKHIETIKNKVDYLTMQQVSEYFNVGYEGIRSLISRHKEELIENGLLILSGKETKEFFLSFGMDGKNIKGGFVVDNFKFANRLNYLVDKRCLLNIAMLLTESEVAKGIRSKLLDIAMGVVEGNIVATNDNSKELIDSFKSQIDFLIEQIISKDKQLENKDEIIKTLLSKLNSNNNIPLIKDKVIEDKDITVYNTYRMNKFIEHINSLPNDTYMLISDYSNLFNSFKFFYRELGVIVVNKFLRENELMLKGEKITDKAKQEKLLEIRQNENHKSIFMTKKGILYVTDLILNNMPYGYSKN